MINIVNKDIFESGCSVVLHQVNCMGVMGRGLALDVRKRYPNVYRSYREQCKSQRYSVNLGGTVHIVAVKEDNGIHYIANLFGQYKYGTDKQYTDYEWFSKGFEYIVTFCKTHNLTLAIPYKIGCNNAGGSWDNILTIMSNILDAHSFTATIYRAPNKKLDELAEFAKGCKYILDENGTEEYEKSKAWEFGSNRMVDKILNKINEIY